MKVSTTLTADGLRAAREFNMVYKVFKGAVRKYYKWQSWSQPVLTFNGSSQNMWLEDPKLTGASNNSAQTQIEEWGTSPMSYFVNAYKSMDADDNNVFYLSAANRPIEDYTNQTYDVLDICFPKYMKLTHIKVVCKFQNGYHCALHRIIGYALNNDGSLGDRLFVVGGSNTVTTLEKDITINHKTRKLRLCLRPDHNNGSYRCQIQEITVTAQQAAEATSSNYDFYEDEKIYQPFESNGTHQAFKDD